MSTLVLFLDIVVFVVVAYWAYANDMRPGERVSKGPFAMKSGSEPGEPVTPGAQAPKWRKSVAKDPATADPAPPRESAPNLPAPQWRRELKGGRRLP